jgi:hypothetical protein
MKTKRNRPSGGTGAATKPGKASTANTSPGEGISVDLALVGPDADIWAQLFDGKFRLAVQCDVCGRWLVAHASKAAGRGPSCAARAVK